MKVEHPMNWSTTRFYQPIELRFALCGAMVLVATVGSLFSQEAIQGQASTKKADGANGGRVFRDVPINVRGNAIDSEGRPVAGATIFLVSNINSPKPLLGQMTS